MAKPSPTLVRAMWKQWLRINELSEWIYRTEFLPAMLAAIPERAERPEFRFLTRRAWLAIDADRRWEWEGEVGNSLRDVYSTAERLFDWRRPDGPADEWITPELLRSTLSTWQERLPYALTVEDAVGLISRVGRLVNVGVAE